MREGRKEGKMDGERGRERERGKMVGWMRWWDGEVNGDLGLDGWFWGSVMVVSRGLPGNSFLPPQARR